MRLESTKAIFNGKLQTTYSLLLKTDAQIVHDHHELNKIRGRIKRSTRQATMQKLKAELSSLAKSMGHTPPSKLSSSHLLGKIRNYKKQNSFLLYAAIDQAIINTCVIYEDFVKRIVLKYYEENIQRIPSKKESLKNQVLIEAILRGDSIHRTIADKVVEDLMYGGIDDWHRTLADHNMNVVTSPILKELFLIRNCIVHNNSRTSWLLHQCTPTKFVFRKPIKPTVADVENYKNNVHRTATFIMNEYNRLHPTNTGTWLR